MTLIYFHLTIKSVGWLSIDINECNLPTEDTECYGECTNTQGSFDCRCPQGTIGNHTIPNGCVEPPKPSKPRNTGGHRFILHDERSFPPYLCAHAQANNNMLICFRFKHGNRIWQWGGRYCLYSHGIFCDAKA